MNRILMLTLLLLPLSTSGNADAQVAKAKETPLMSKALPDVPGKEAVVETVVLSPGEVVPAHRHNADVFAYVLEGSMITQVEGGKPQTVHAGEAFYEYAVNRRAFDIVLETLKFGGAP